MTDLRPGDRPGDAAGDAPVLGRPLPPRPSTKAPADPVAALTRQGPGPAPRKPRPDPGPLRIAIGLTGIATASALVTAFLGPSSGAVTTAQTATADQAAVPTTTVAVKHVTRYVQLAPGQTAPPKAVVTQAPAPKQRVVVVTTKQSGK